MNFKNMKPLPQEPIIKNKKPQHYLSIAKPNSKIFSNPFSQKTKENDNLLKKGDSNEKLDTKNKILKAQKLTLFVSSPPPPCKPEEPSLPDDDSDLDLMSSDKNIDIIEISE